MTRTHNGHTLQIEINGATFIGDLIGKRGKALAGYVCGNIATDGTLSNVRHVNGTNCRAL